MASRLAPYEQPTPIAIVQIALASFAGSVLCALAYMLAGYFRFPPTHETPLLLMLLDPFVILIAGALSIGPAVIVFPFATLALRGRRLWPSFWVVTGATIAVIVASMQVWPSQSWLVGFVAVFPLLFASRAIPQLGARVA